MSMSQTIDPDVIMSGSAVAGSLVAQLLNTKVVTVRRMIGLGIAGALTGIFCSPAISDLLAIGKDNVHIRAAISFATGFLGIALCTLVINFAETTSFPIFLARIFGLQFPPDVIPEKPPVQTK